MHLLAHGGLCLQSNGWHAWDRKGKQAGERNAPQLKAVLAALPDAEHKQACQLLYYLLHPEQEHRLNLRQALQSPFLKMPGQAALDSACAPK